MLFFVIIVSNLQREFESRAVRFKQWNRYTNNLILAGNVFIIHAGTSKTENLVAKNKEHHQDKGIIMCTQEIV